MNEAKWADSKIPLIVLALKLSEEAAEVGGEITDALTHGRPVDREAIIEELAHTVFIAQTMRDRILAEIRERVLADYDDGTWWLISSSDLTAGR